MGKGNGEYHVKKGWRERDEGVLASACLFGRNVLAFPPMIAVCIHFIVKRVIHTDIGAACVVDALMHSHAQAHVWHGARV